MISFASKNLSALKGGHTYRIKGFFNVFYSDRPFLPTPLCVTSLESIITAVEPLSSIICADAIAVTSNICGPATINPEIPTCGV